METVVIPKRKFNALEPFDNGYEADVFKIELKNKWATETKLLKKLYLDSGTSFGNKLLTINTLIDFSSKLEADFLVLPEKLAILDNKIVGYIMRFIEGFTLQHILDDKNISNEYKIDCFRKIGSVLRKMEVIRTYKGVPDFFLGDMHEKNFLVDLNDEIKVIDLDSSKIGNNQSFPSRYLYSSNGMGKLNKKYETSSFGVTKVDENTDLYCYNIMILNFLSGVDISLLTVKDFYNYIQYLEDIKLNHKLTTGFSLLYTKNDNINTDIYLDESIDFEKSKYLEYKKKYNIV